MKLLDDTDLIHLISQRNEAALGELYDRYNRLVFSVAFGVMGDHGSAEEITLDIFTRVWEKAHTYDSSLAKVSTWLTRMARNLAIDFLRREQVRPMKHSIRWADVVFEPTVEDNNPESVTQLAMDKRQVRNAMASLSQAQQEVLALAYFKGHTHREIADVLALPLGTVKGRIRSGLQKMRHLLIDE